MPFRSPFTRLCQQASEGRACDRADLHVHSTHSDGLFTPHEIVERARQAGLFAVALADHDTLSGVAVAQAAAGTELEVVSGVEISCEFAGSELHLLGYFVPMDDPDLNAALERVRRQRVERFVEMARRLNAGGASIAEDEIDRRASGTATLGRRHLAQMLLATGRVQTLNQAFVRYLGRQDIASAPKLRLPVAEAIALVRNAGGVASWAHPPQHFDAAHLDELHRLGLQAVECEYPWPTRSHGRRLKEAALARGLAITGGSDCHGPNPASRAIGCRGIERRELEQLRALAAQRQEIAG